MNKDHKDLGDVTDEILTSYETHGGMMAPICLRNAPWRSFAKTCSSFYFPGSTIRSRSIRAISPV